MFYIFCLIIVVVAAQPVISDLAKDVHEAYIQTIELSKGLTKNMGTVFGNQNGIAKEVDPTATVEAAIEESLKVDGIAFVRANPNYIVVSANLGVDIKIGYCFRYDWSQKEGTNSRGLDIADVKIVTSVKDYEFDGMKHVKIFYEALECTINNFGKLDLHFRTVETGIVNLEKSEANLTNDDLTAKFGDLKKYIGQKFTPQFTKLILQPNDVKSRKVLSEVTGTITGVVVTVTEKKKLQETNADLEYNFALKYTAE